MTLLELCQPLFKKVCFLNRSAKKKGAPLDLGQVESDIDDIFRSMRQVANSVPGLAEQFERVEAPLIYFFDNFMTVKSPFPFTDDYRSLAERRGLSNTGNTEFYLALQEALKEPENPSNSARLEVFYTCLGLGFTWEPLDEPAFRKKTMNQIARRIRTSADSTERARVTPQAYEHTLVDDLIPPPVGPVWRIAVLMAGLLIVLIIFDGYLYKSEVTKLGRALNSIVEGHK